MAQQLGMLPKWPVPPPPTPCSLADPRLGEDSPKGTWLPKGRADRKGWRRPIFSGDESQKGSRTLGTALTCDASVFSWALSCPHLSRPGLTSREGRAGSPATGQCHTSLSPHHPGLQPLLKAVPGAHKEQRSLGLSPGLLWKAKVPPHLLSAD